MRMPENTLRTQHLRSYGAADMEMEGIGKIAGCPAVYKAKYVDHRLVEPRSYPLEYGTVIHDALFLAEDEGLPLLPDALDKAWSRTEIALDSSAYEEAMNDLTAFMDRGGLNLSTIAVEQELKMPLMEYKGEQWFFGGRLDWIGIDANDPTTIYYADYKTNRAPPRQVDVDNDPQFTGYGLLLKANLDKYLPGADPDEIQVVGIMEAIKWYTLQTHRETWQCEQYLDWLRAMARRIIDDEAGDPKLNDSCTWCPLKFDCKEFRRLPGRGETVLDRMSTRTDLADRVVLMQEAQLIVRSLDAVVKEVREELRQEAIRREEPIVVNGVAYEAKESWETDWRLKELHDLLGDEFYNVVSVTGYKVDDWLKPRKEMESAIDSCRPKYPAKDKKLSAKASK